MLDHRPDEQRGVSSSDADPLGYRGAHKLGGSLRRTLSDQLSNLTINDTIIVATI
jgi:hypothetical protein